MSAISRMFTPPVAEPITEKVELQVMGACLETDGRLFLTMRAWNGDLLHAGRADGESDRSRKSFAAEVVKRMPTLQPDDVTTTIMRAAVKVADLLRASAQSGAEEAPPQVDMAALWLAAQPLAEAPDLLERVDAAFSALGVVGEHRNRKLLYLAATARLLDRPVCVFVTGPSSAGKSYLLQKLIDLLPASAYVNYTSVSARYLAYSADDLCHRIVFLFEADGLSTGTGAYIMRSLISENRLEIGTVEKNEAGQMVARKAVKEGPTALFSSTTETREIDDELLTRLLRCTVTDNPDHSRAILRGIAAAHTGEQPQALDLTPFHALQEWLAAKGPCTVLIPYARSLAESVPVGTVRIRRDFPQLLSLIKASAILHRAQRQATAEGAIIATLDDYRIVRDLMAESFASAQTDGITAEQRAAIAAVAALRENHSAEDGVSLAQVAAYLKRDKSATQRRLVNPLRAGYVVNLNAGLKGRKAAYVLGDPLPDEDSALPQPEDLTEEGTL